MSTSAMALMSSCSPSASIAFDPIRAAILLIGGNKTGDKRFYKTMIPVAHRLYDEHIAALKREGLIP